MALRPVGTKYLKVPSSGSESTYVLPANCELIKLSNQSGAQIRWALAASIVTASPLSLPHTYNTLEPGMIDSKEVKLSSGTIRYAGNIEGAKFTINAFVKA